MRRALEAGRFGPETVADARHSQWSQGSAALILQRALQPLVEITCRREKLLERLRRRLRARQHREEAEAPVALRIHGREVEGAGPGERGGAQHRSIRLIGLVEDRELAEEETLRREREPQRPAGKALRLRRDD